MKLDPKNCGRYQGFLEARRAFEKQIEQQVASSELSPEMAYEAMANQSLCLGWLSRLLQHRRCAAACKMCLASSGRRYQTGV